LKPDIILYGEPHPRSEEIAQTVAKDVKKIDLLLVVGTGMKVDGIQHVIRSLAQAATSRMVRKTAISSLPTASIYMNMEFSGQSKWLDIFQCWVKGDCEEFATMVRAEFDSSNVAKEKTRTSGNLGGQSKIDNGEKGDIEDVSSSSTFRQKVVFANRRVDLRPLCRYF
jgi:hypothetical protein